MSKKDKLMTFLATDCTDEECRQGALALIKELLASEPTTLEEKEFKAGVMAVVRKERPDLLAESQYADKVPALARIIKALRGRRGRTVHPLGGLAGGPGDLEGGRPSDQAVLAQKEKAHTLRTITKGIEDAAMTGPTWAVAISRSILVSGANRGDLSIYTATAACREWPGPGWEKLSPSLPVYRYETNDLGVCIKAATDVAAIAHKEIPRPQHPLAGMAGSQPGSGGPTFEGDAVRVSLEAGAPVQREVQPASPNLYSQLVRTLMKYGG